MLHNKRLEAFVYFDKTKRKRRGGGGEKETREKEELGRERDRERDRTFFFTGLFLNEVDLPCIGDINGRQQPEFPLYSRHMSPALHRHEHYTNLYRTSFELS